MTQAIPACIICEKNDQVKFYSKATDIEYFTTQDYYNFYECTGCHALQIYPVPTDKLSIIYPSNYYSFLNSKKSFVTKIKEALDKSFFKRLLKDVKMDKINVLDVGGGTGWLINLLKEIDSRISITQVVDIDPKAAELAQQKGHRYFCGPIEQFTSETKFDVVLLLNLIEHVESPVGVLKIIKNLLSANGIVIIKTPNYESWDASLFKNANWGGYHCPRHWHLFTQSSFKKLTEKSGLTMMSFNYTQGAPFWAISIMGWLKKTKIVRAGADHPAIYHPLYSLLVGLFAGFDIVRGLFTKTSQMFIVLKKLGIVLFAFLPSA